MVTVVIPILVPIVMVVASNVAMLWHPSSEGAREEEVDEVIREARRLRMRLPTTRQFVIGMNNNSKGRSISLT